MTAPAESASHRVRVIGLEQRAGAEAVPGSEQLQVETTASATNTEKHLSRSAS